MDITPAVQGLNLIDSYGPDRFRVRGAIYRGSLIVTAGQVLPWPVTEIGTLTLDAFVPVRKMVPPIEVLLLGTGARTALVPSMLRKEIRAAGIAMDIMHTGAACRTFNVLMMEGRHAAAALIAV